MNERESLKPEFIKKIRQIEKQKFIRIDDFAKHFGLDRKNGESINF